MAQRAKSKSSRRRERNASAPPKAVVLGPEGETVDEVALAPEVFGASVNAHLLYEAAKKERADKRRGTHMTKNRALVSGSGRKPWRQKGTGRARVGESRNPIWRHGGTVFGPTPRDHGLNMPKAARSSALRSALSARATEGALKIIQGFRLKTAKTRELRGLLTRLGIAGKALLVDFPVEETLTFAGRNLASVRIVDPFHVTVNDVLGCRTIVVSQEALERLEERLTP
jgi:large subunit ribosomal protein L4